MSLSLRGILFIMKITHVVAEVYPLASVGGYSRVVHALSNKQSEENIVSIVTPFYSGFSKDLINRISHPQKVKVLNPKLSSFEIEYSVLKINKNLTIYLIINKDYYQFRTNIYGYTDDANRWAYLSFCALELIKLKIIPTDVIHTHDWHTGILANIKKQYYHKLNIPVTFTIHNLKFQAMFDHRNSDLKNYDKWQSLGQFFEPELQKLNYLKRAIRYSDKCVFVSDGYLNEVLNGVNDELLNPLLIKNKQKLTSVLNRIDAQFNPFDINIHKNYNKNSIKLKEDNKLFLQKMLGLSMSNRTPLLCFVGRLDEQKGISLLIDALDVILRNSNAQFVQLGGGDSNYIPLLEGLAKKYKNRVYIYGKTDFNITAQIYASSDICLVPSKFEPCGIVPMEAQVFGCIPIVNSTGGLKDTTFDYHFNRAVATGFVFNDYDINNFIFKISSAIEVYNNIAEWKRLVINAMSQDYSWDKSAKEYMGIYKRVLDACYK